MSKIKNILIFVAIGGALFGAYFFFLKPAPDQGSLVSSSSNPLPNVNGSLPATNETQGQNASISKDFVTFLLSVKNIKLDDSIFSDPAFNGLEDSSITLVPDATTGRPNPFAKLGSDDSTPAVPPANTSDTITPIPDVVPTPTPAPKTPTSKPTPAPVNP